MPRLLALPALVLAVTPLAVTPLAAADPTPEDAKLAAHFRAYLDDYFRRHPSFATISGDHQYDDRLEDLSAEAVAADVKAQQAALAGLPTAIAYDKLSRAGQIDYEIWRHTIEYDLWQTKTFDPYATNPRMYNVFISDGVFQLFTQSTLPKDRNVANAAGRIAGIPKLVAAAKANLKNPPRIVTEVAIKQNLGSIAFYEKDIFALTGETPAVSPLAGPCRDAVAALREYQTFLETELLPRSTGEWRIGKEAFAAKLQRELNAGLTAEEVIAEAEAEAIRVEREMYTIAKQQWGQLFPGVALPPDDEAGRRACTKAVLDELGKDHGQPDELVEDARRTVDKIKAFIRERKILTLPEPDRCKIIEMPEFQRGFSVAYLSPAPPLDPKADSLYAVAPPPADWSAERKEAFFREYNRPMLQVLTIHEAYPGHYVQLEYSNRNPSLVRKVLYSGIYAEGWAVYTEQTMLDQGYGEGDLSLRLHQLKFYLRAILNAILDHKMHCTEMTDEEALALLIGRGFQTEGEAVGKVQRAKLSSCQLSTYFVGRTAFYRLRQSVERNRGDSFNLGAYHEEVLNLGTIPVKYLAELVK